MMKNMFAWCGTQNHHDVNQTTIGITFKLTAVKGLGLACIHNLN